MNFIHSFRLVFCLVLITSSASIYAAKFYKWVDENGNTHYSDKAPAQDTEVETVHVTTSKPSSTQNASSDFPADTQPDTQTTQQDSKEMQAYCEKLSENISTLEESSVVQSIDSEGNRQQLSKEEQNKQLTQQKAQYDKNCAH